MESLFHAAAELELQDRPAFLAAACGTDAALRQEVESLLDSAGKTLGLLQTPVHEAARNLASAAGLEQQRLGPYQLIGLIGQGGMGDVYLAARADEQFQKRVAIKIMRATPAQVEALLPRFRNERQILANLDHPNIARILDGGVTPEGLPYFVMEFVEGAPIDEYCTRGSLSTQQRLILFRTVCSAVQHAHHNLVVHRDIKPANILVTADGVPKLLDFGIAKLLDPDISMESTRPTQRLMTPEYASPEQLLGHPVTTATDVYGLGVLLYELLAGCRSSSVKTDSPLASQPAPRKLDAELATVVQKAMSPQPSARYESVEQFAADIQAWLTGRPVSTCPNTWRYRARKFIARHQRGIAAATVAVLALIGFTIGMAILAHRANVERLRAERESRFLADMFKAVTPDVARGRTVTARDLLDQAARRIDRELAAVPEVRGSLLHNIAEAYHDLGLFDQATALADRSYNLKVATLGRGHPSTADTLFLRANLLRQKGDYAKAEPLFRELVAIRKRNPGENAPAYASSLSALGECLYLEAKDAEAEPLLRQSLAIYRRNGPDFGDEVRNYLALLVERKGDYAEAAALLTEAVDIDRRTEGADSPNYAISLHNLASAMIDAGDLSGAETKLRETLAIRRKVMGDAHPMLAYTLNNLGYVLLEKGDGPAAEPFLREALELNRRRLGEQHPSVAVNLNNWARLLQAEGDYTGAGQYFARALATLRTANSFTSWTAAQVLGNLGLLEFDKGRYGAAETWTRQSLEMRRKLGGENTPAVASALIELGQEELFAGDPLSAEPVLREALELRRKKFAPKHPAIISAEVRLGEALVAEGQEAQAEPLLREALTAARTAPFPLLPWQVAEAGSALGACLTAMHQTAAAEPLLRDSTAPLLKHPRPAFRQPATVRLLALNRKSHEWPDRRY